MSAEWAGFKTVGQCEFADYPTKVLERHWPDVQRWKDVRDVTDESVRERTGINPGELTLLSGGFPCQPHSLAGKRMASGDERDLWGEFARVIRELRPKWMLAENVPGLLSSENGRFFGRILRDLAEMGYSVGWCCYPASQVGAIHRRERVFIVGNAVSRREGTFGEIQGRTQNAKLSGIDKIIANPNKQRLQGRMFAGKQSKTNEQLERAYLYLLGRADEKYLSESAILRGNHGVPNRVDRSKCLGNAVVPQQVFPILDAIARIEGCDVNL